MGIFTTLDANDIKAALAAYDLALIDFHGVTEGTVNTYYRLDTDRGLYYLRIDERGDENAVRNELNLLSFLRDLSVPHVVTTTDGRAYLSVHGKPALLFEPLSGGPVHARSAAQYAEIGAWLATLHAVSIPKDLPLHRFHPQALQTIYHALRDALTGRYTEAQKTADALFAGGWQTYTFADLPQALIHADMFEENLLFENGALSGVLDFEAAGRGPRLLDLAITIQALCFDVEKKAFNVKAAQALVTAYKNTIPLEDAERQAWPQMLAYSALRFLVTRLKDFELSGLTPEKGHWPKTGYWKDYREYLDHLRDLDRLHCLIQNHVPVKRRRAPFPLG